MDHNSYLYDKRFLDLWVPLIVNDFASNSTASERMERAKKRVEFNDEIIDTYESKTSNINLNSVDHEFSLGE